MTPPPSFESYDALSTAAESLPQLRLPSNFSSLLNHGVDYVYNEIKDVELFDAEEMGKKWIDLSEDVQACVDAEPRLYETFSTLALVR